MAKVTTARILVDKALQRPCGQQCVDWAITMLEEGADSDYLTMLAGMRPPYNQFELADFRDRALREIAVPDLDNLLTVRTFVAQQLRLALAGRAGLIETLGAIRDLCLVQEYADGLFDFYRLYEAHDDLRKSERQYYWEGATRENIDSHIRQRAEQFLRDFPKTI